MEHLGLRGFDQAVRHRCGISACPRQVPELLRKSQGTCNRSRRCCIVRSAAGEDPYKVLGIPRKADSVQINRVYKKKLAEFKGNEAETSRIEAAHTSIMMSGLSSRLSGGMQIDKEVAYADRAKFFPWRPRLHIADQKLIRIAAGVHGILAAWALFLRATAGYQPLITSVVAGAGITSWKLNQIFPPPPPSSEGPSKNRQGMKNIIRGAGLSIFVTFLGCFLAFTAPDLVAAQLNRALPYWFYESEALLLSLGTISGNFIINTLYR